MNKYFETNLLRWNEVTSIHFNSDFYNVDLFKRGETSLKSIELNALGDVSGKSLLHLQCHFGLDTLSWARLGANVTGVDFSNEAIAVAKSLANEVGINARFICCNLYDINKILCDKFDIIFTSYGVLSWLDDIHRWAEVIAHSLKPGGIFYIVEFHPTADLFDIHNGGKELRIRYPYFNKEPIKFDSKTTYGDTSARLNNTVSYEWPHSISDVINALLSTGLKIQSFDEYPHSVYEHFPGLMKKDQYGWWRLKSEYNIPLMYSIRAINSLG